MVNIFNRNVRQPADAKSRAWSQSDASQAAVLGLLIFGALAIGLRSFAAEAPRDEIDTKFRTGTHISFILIAPTSNANRAFVDAISSARDSVRAYARRNNYIYTTIGIADDWNPERGVEQLSEYGHFDELIVGRNWLNSGVELYVTQEAAPNEVPQVLIVRRTVSVDSLPVQYGPLTQILRMSGTDDVLEWARAGFPILALREPGAE